MNWVFLIAAAALCAAALGFILFPLLRDSAPGAHQRSRREVNAAVHRDRLAELDQDLAQGTLSREQHTEAVADLERELVQSGAVDPDDDASGQASGHRATVITSAAIAAVAVPVLAVGLYTSVGFGEQVFQGDNQSQAQRQGGDPSLADDAQNLEDIRALAEQLRERMDEQPEDLMGWVLLGRTLSHLQEYEEASEAFGEAVARGGDNDPDLLVRYAQALGEASGSLQGPPKELIDQALEIAPEHPQALWLAGSAAYHTADYASAREHWETLLSMLPDDSEGASSLRATLEDMPGRGSDG